MRRAAAAVAAAFLLMLVGAAPASADIGPIDVPNPFGSLIDQMCDPKSPPTPQPPMNALGMVNGVPEARHGGMARYGYAGLFWTTYDRGCLSLDRLDTSTAASLNDLANAGDTMVNQVQALALDPDAAAPFDGMLTTAVGGIGHALWSPWLAVPLAAVGVVACFAAAAGRVTTLGAILLNAVIVLGAVTFLLAHPTTVTHASDGLTSAVAARTASGLVDATGGGHGPNEQAIPEGYYRISYEAWTDGAFCGDRRVMDRYGPRLRDAQAFSVTEYDRVRDDPAALKALVQRKQGAWTDIAEELKDRHPAAFGCWSGATGARTGAAIRHLVVTVCAGVPVVIAAMAVLVLKNMLRFGLLVVAGLGLIMLVSRRVSSAALEFLLTCIVGSALVAGGAGVLMFGYYAILADPNAAWWTSIVGAFAFGAAVLFSWKHLSRITRGATAVDAVGGRGRRLAGAAGAKASTWVGAGAGGAVVAAAAHDDAPSSDAARRPDPVSDDAAPSVRQVAPSLGEPPAAAPAPAPEPVPAADRVLVAVGATEHPQWAAEAPMPEPDKPDDERLPDHVRDHIRDDLAWWSEQARRRGTPPADDDLYQPPPVP